MAVSKRLRYEILRRDKYTCRYCGASAPDVPLTVDHVTPVALGGTDHPSNLAASCEPCNSGKTSSTPDATLVADVSDDALRWAAAMTQAAESLREQETPKLEYRAAFLAEWNRWHVGKDDDKKVPLDNNWKQSIERFRVAGVPTWMWADIVDVGMANEKVKPENTFRYCCGIAWNKVAELQAEARKIVGSSTQERAIDPLVQAAVSVWVSEQSSDPDGESLSQFRASAEELLRHQDVWRVMYAAQHAAWFGQADATAALSAADHDDAAQAWNLAWFAASGEFPDGTRAARVGAQISALLDGGVYAPRVAKAAEYAGSRRVTYLYFGLSEEEQGLIGTDTYMVKAIEAWAESFHAASARWPDGPEQAAFLKSLCHASDDGGIWLADIYQAAAAAGSYQDPDITTCLTRRLSVFEAAALPVGGEN